MLRYGVPAKESEVPPKEVVDYFASGNFNHVIPPSTKRKNSGYVIGKLRTYLGREPIISIEGKEPEGEEQKGEEIE